MQVCLFTLPLKALQERVLHRGQGYPCKYSCTPIYDNVPLSASLHVVLSAVFVCIVLDLTDVHFK